MYAIVQAAGKQYRATRGQFLTVDRLQAEPGSTLVLDQVLLVGSTKGTLVGQPLVDGVTVEATVVRHERGEKIRVFKYKPKKRSRVRHGARRDLTVISVNEIKGSTTATLDDDAELAAAKLEADQKAQAEAEARRESIRARKTVRTVRPQRAKAEPVAEAEAEPVAEAGPVTEAELVAEEAAPAAEGADEAAEGSGGGEAAPAEEES